VNLFPFLIDPDELLKIEMKEKLEKQQYKLQDVQEFQKDSDISSDCGSHSDDHSVCSDSKCENSEFDQESPKRNIKKHGKEKI
tara:strand:- start:15 stop:263 length:249 start_codon:yes stop_codon:yes gene_type:complete